MIGGDPSIGERHAINERDSFTLVSHAVENTPWIINVWLGIKVIFAPPPLPVLEGFEGNAAYAVAMQSW